MKLKSLLKVPIWTVTWMYGWMDVDCNYKHTSIIQYILMLSNVVYRELVDLILNQTKRDDKDDLIDLLLNMKMA